MDEDASYAEIKQMQEDLARYGITKKMCDLDNYAGLTADEIKSIVKGAIEWKQKKDKVLTV